jgi:sugar phosphate isomerase/epimerase
MRIGLSPDQTWQLSLPELARLSAAAGFSALGVGIAEAGPAGADALSQAGLSCHELTALIITGNEAKTLGYAERAAQSAAAVSADYVLTTVASLAGGPALIRRCADILAAAGTKMALEFSPLGVLGSIAGARELIELSGSDQVRVLIDTWHFFRGSSTWEQLETIPLDQIAYVQFDDALEAVSEDGMDETVNRRAFPGDGVFALERFAQTLLGRGWDGTVGVEVLSAELRTLPVPDFVERAYTSTARYWI